MPGSAAIWGLGIAAKYNPSAPSGQLPLHRGAFGLALSHTIGFTGLVKAFSIQEQPFGAATRKTTTLQKAGACASEAQGMRETWQGGPLAVDEAEME